MKKFKTDPFKPFVEIDEVLRFDPDRKETFTQSLLMNAVLTAMKREKFTQLIDVARYMQVDKMRLGYALQLVCGMTFNEMRDHLLRYTVQRLREQHPEWSKTELAQALGYSDHTALWRLFHREYDHNYYKKLSQHWRDD